MEKYHFRVPISFFLLLSLQAIADDRNAEIELLNRSIELSGGTVPHAKMDAESARKILAYFSTPKGRWAQFLGKIREGKKGAIVTALYLIEYANGETQQELNFTLQETLITLPDVVLDANAKTQTPQTWICGKPAYENYDLAVQLNDERIAALKSMLAAMESKDEKIRELYDRKLKPAAESCLKAVRSFIRN